MVLPGPHTPPLSTDHLPSIEQSAGTQRAPPLRATSNISFGEARPSTKPAQHSPHNAIQPPPPASRDDVCPFLARLLSRKWGAGHSSHNNAAHHLQTGVRFQKNVVEHGAVKY
ncbi:unnamed protein product [Ostreobium quekettii]|uniref:Uncharacterized protein n=1 Tax=Ostreobium quekettii TaxID=121088 RepID=A0A8S1IJV4_9CHLO|nr:unnamed protein product [Ostreobium quekettii]